VFETLRVAQRAVEAGLIRVTARQPPRPRWRTILPIEAWLVGGELRGTAPGPGPVGAAVAGARGTAPQGTQSAEPVTTSRKKRKKKRRADTPPAVPVSAPATVPGPREIDWGALVPRIVGAEVGPLAGVVPASHVSGEIVAARDQAEGAGRSGVQDPPVAIAVTTGPTIVFDEAAGLPTTARDAERPEADPRAEADAERAKADVNGEPETAEARAQAIRAIAATVSVSSEPARVIDDLELGDTTPERGFPAEPAMPAATAAVRDGIAIDTSDAITAPIAVPRPAEPADAPPAAIEDELSDGVVRTSVVAEPAPSAWRPDDPIPDDRPAETTGEITMPRARPEVAIRLSEPSILVADLAAALSLDAPMAEVHRDTEEFSDLEEAFFRAGHEKEAVAESFDDLDEGYRPVGFWERLRGRPTRPPTSPDDPDKK